MKKIIILLVFIILLGSFLRFLHVGAVPISPNWDEAALGYNAFSLLKTGKDEFNTSYPFVLKSFNNYTPALYSYITIPFIWFFGLSPYSTRLPSAIWGVLMIIGAFFLTWQILALSFKDKTFIGKVSLLTTLLVAISPWHIQFSRVAYEANIALTWCVYGLLFFLLGLKKPFFLILSAIMYGLSINTYHSPRLFVPLILISLFILFRKQLIEHKLYLTMASIIGVISLFPFFYYIFLGQQEYIVGRFSTTTIINQQTTTTFETPNSIFEHIGYFFTKTPLLEKSFQIANGYLKHISLNWLFITGDNNRHHAPSMGLMYLWEAPFLLLGLFSLLKQKGKTRIVLFTWILLALIPASLTSELPHAVRTLILLPSLYMLISIGIYVFFQRITQYKKIISIPLSVFFLIIVTYSFIRFYHLYFYHMNHEYSNVWQFGYEHAVNYVRQHEQEYTKVIVSNKLEQPYIFFLFYLQYDPSVYLMHGGTKDSTEKAFGKYEFRTIQWDKEIADSKTLYILSPEEKPENPLHIIRYFDSNEAFIFAKKE